MANFVPALFGKPSFGSQERDAWLEALMLFLADPFRPVGGRYNFEVPADAINFDNFSIPGEAIWRNNSHGIRELNEFSEFVTIADTATRNVSDRPCVLFAYNATDNVAAVYLMVGTSFASSGAFRVYATDTTKWTTNAPLAGNISAYHDGSSAFILDNQMGHSVNVFCCVVSLGDPITS